VLYFADGTLSDAVAVTTRAAVVVARAIEAVTGNAMKIKWVNDIYDDNGKVAGILAESVAMDDKIAVIVGVGINIGEADFPDELSRIASSIGMINENERGEIIEKIAEGLVFGLEVDFIEEYRKRFMLRDERVELFSAGESLGCGIALGVDDEGGLIFRPDGKAEPRIIRSGEVSVRKR
jgi:BirA family biotin operon repressor/biotin-[acetyl-CoA-carboxylase] ligase